MNTRHDNSRRSKRRGHVFAAFVLAFLYIAQPALAFLSAGSRVAPCQANGESCCCTEKVEAPVPAKSCCGTKESTESEEPTKKQCDCRVSSGKLPAQTPALPVDKSSASAEGTLFEWVRVHADVFSHTHCGPPAKDLSPGVRDGTPPRYVEEHPLARHHSSVGAWALLMRGVSGFLAVLSVART